MMSENIRIFLRISLSLSIGGIILFLSAGRMDWWPGWIYLGISIINQSFAYIYLKRKNPALLKERSRVVEGVKAWDKSFVVVQGTLGPVCICVVSGLDERFGWSAAPSGLPIAALVACLFASAFSLWAGAVNPFFSALVRIQKDRGHRVISSGPYALVRHPGYLGGVIFTLALPLLLDSFWAFLPAFLTAGVVVLRTAKEDRTLHEELQGYLDYSGRVRYRLFPGLW